MAATRVGGRWGEPGPVGFVGGEGCLHRVVDVEDGVLGPVVAVSLLVLAADDGEGVQDVGDGVARGWEAVLELRELLGRFVAGAAVGAACRAPVAVCLRWQVQVEEGGVQFAAEEEAAPVVPAEGRAFPAAIGGEVTKTLSRVEKLKHARSHEFELGIGEGSGRGHCNLLHREVLQAGSTDLFACGEIEYERVEGAQ